MRFRAHDLPDEALIAGIAAGDEAAGAAFVRRYQGRVYGLALSILGDPGLAEDVTQETLVRVWRHAGAFDARRGSACGWILTIARNLAVDVLRLRRTDPVDPDVLATLLAESELDGPEPAAMRGAAIAGVRVALGELSPEQRRAVLLAAFYGRTAAEIAASESVPLGTAKTRIRSGMLRLRAALEESRT